jgi:hypothetical protein
MSLIISDIHHDIQMSQIGIMKELLITQLEIDLGLVKSNIYFNDQLKKKSYENL